MKIAELPFQERPAIEVLALDRDDEDPEYAGYGWARVPRLWLEAEDGGGRRRIDDALVLAIHAADDGEPLADDVVLAFELDGGDRAVTVLASDFLERWLPRLPREPGAVVLAMCNPHRAVLRAPAAATAPIYCALGDVRAWLDLDDLGDRIRLAAGSWRRLGDVSTELERAPAPVISDDDKLTYAGLYVLKKMDLKPKDGGITIPIVLPPDMSQLDDVLQHLGVEGYVELNQRKDRWDITKKGIAYLGRVMDEAGELIDEFDDEELEDVVAELRRRNLDPYRARFIWGWYDGEFDDLVQFQEQRGVRPIERMWSFYLMGDRFWAELARELKSDWD